MGGYQGFSCCVAAATRAVSSDVERHQAEGVLSPHTHVASTRHGEQASISGSRNTTLFNVLAKPWAKACQTYNKGGCALAEQHPKELHVFAYCLAALNHLCAHQEKFCRRKQYAAAKNF